MKATHIYVGFDRELQGKVGILYPASGHNDPESCEYGAFIFNVLDDHGELTDLACYCDAEHVKARAYERERAKTLRFARKLDGATPEQRAALWAEKRRKALAKIREYESQARAAEERRDVLGALRANGYAESWRREYVRCGGSEPQSGDAQDAARWRWWCKWWFDEKDDMEKINDLEYEDQATLNAAVDSEIASESHKPGPPEDVGRPIPPHASGPAAYYPPVPACPSCGLPPGLQPCDERGTITPCFDPCHGFEPPSSEDSTERKP